MKLSNDQIQRIIDVNDLETAYSYYKTFSLDCKELKEIETKIKHGIKIKIPINVILLSNQIDGLLTLRPSQRTISMRGYGTYTIQDYYDEIADRTALIKKTILDNMTEEELFEPRDEWTKKY